MSHPITVACFIHLASSELGKPCTILVVFYLLTSPLAISVLGCHIIMLLHCVLMYLKPNTHTHTHTHKMFVIIYRFAKATLISRRYCVCNVTEIWLKVQVFTFLVVFPLHLHTCCTTHTTPYTIYMYTPHMCMHHFCTW